MKGRKSPDRVGLHKSVSLLRATLESTADGVLVVDSLGKITTYNRQFADMWRIPPEVLSSGNDDEVLDFVLDQLKDPEGFRAKVRELYAHPGEESFDTLEFKDGRIFERYSRPHLVDKQTIGRVWSFRDVTEHRRAEERLRESEERFRLITENVGDLVAMIDTEGRRIYNSPSYRALFNDGIEPGSDSFREIHPEDRDRIKELFRETVATGAGHRTEFRFVLHDGSIRYIESESRGIRDAAGKVSKVVLVSRDVSERKRAEQRERMEHAVTRVLAESDTLADAIPRIIQAICETLNWDCGARWSLDEREKAIVRVEKWSIPDEAVAEFAERARDVTLEPARGGLVRQVWVSGTPHWIPDVSNDESFTRARFAAKAGLHGAFAFPILAGNVTLGVLEFFSRETRNPDPSLLQMVRVIGSQIGQFMARKQAEENLLYVATHDTLTGLPNRYMFNQRFAHALNNAQRYRKTMALLFLDLDRFKFINDTLGHPFGDRLLVEVASRLRMCLRESDTIARFGGDEFVALIEDYAEPGDVVSVAQKILHALRWPFLLEGETCHISASIGISLYPNDGEDLSSLLKNADIAAYRTKEQGKNNYLFYSEDMNDHLSARIARETKLKGALERSEFVLHYEPKVEILTDRITGMEALIRWQHPELGLIPPVEFHRPCREFRTDRPDRCLGAQDRVREQPEASEPFCRPADGLGEPVCASVRRQASAAGNRTGAQGKLAQAEQPRARDHREHGDAGHPELEEDPRRDQVDGHSPRDRRLRHRLFVLRIAQAVPVRLHQDRPLVHQGHPPRSGRCRDHAGDHRDGAQPGAEGHSGGSRNPRAARFSQGARLPRVSGLLFQEAAARGRALPAAARERGGRSRRNRLSATRKGSYRRAAGQIQSIFAPERFTTSAHLAESLRIVSAKSSGVPPAGSSPISPNLALNTGETIALLMEALSLSTTGLGMPAGPITPLQVAAS